MKTIEITEREIKMLCTAIRVVLGQINPAAKRIEVNPRQEDLNEWAQLNKKTSCAECSLNENNVCTVCGAEWGVLTPDAAQGLMNWVVTTGLYNGDGTQADAAELKQFVDSCARVRDSEVE